MRKTDRLDAQRLLRLLLRAELWGEREAFSAVRVPSEEQEAALRTHRERERLVKERTGQLADANARLRASNKELERFNRAMVGRELRMIELKRLVNELSGRLGQPPPYAVDFSKEQPAPPPP